MPETIRDTDKPTQFTVKQSFQDAFEAMKSDHQVYVSTYQELSDYINPTRGIFNNDRTKIGRKIDHKRLISSYGTHALRIFASGLNSGMTNKSTRWFKPKYADDRYLQVENAKESLDMLENRMYDILNQSNIYDVFYHAYEEMGQFGPACFSILEDMDDVARGRSFTAGEYYLATDRKGRVNAFAREFEMTVAQMVNEFGLESCSQQVQAHYKNANQRNTPIKICHLIDENTTRDMMLSDFENMPWRSVYWEKGNTTDGFLAKRGFKRFPIVAPRWETITTDDVYGTGPGWHSLGAIKELQQTRKDKLMAQEKYHDPPTIEDSLNDGPFNSLPGARNKVSTLAPNTGVRAAYQIDLVMDSFIQALSEIKEEIDRFYFVNLFLMLINVDTGKMTATEVAERQQEKLMMLGPALHRLDEEMLTPTLELLYGIMEDNGLLPDFPEALEGAPIKIEYTSILAQTQKEIGVAKIERVLGIVGASAQMSPDIIDNIDFDEVVRETNIMTGAPAKIIREVDDVSEIRTDRANQQNAQMAMQSAQVAADTTKKLADAKTDEPSALTGLMKSAGQ